MQPSVPRVLIVAGSDSGGGAGIQADLKTVTALGGWGMTAITALTAQNTLGVAGILPVEPSFVAAQMQACASDIGADAVKTGMLVSTPIIEAVAAALRDIDCRAIVVDPVMLATSGAPLLQPEAIDTLRRSLFPLAAVITPNLLEAARLLGRTIERVSEMREAARSLADLGPQAVLVKGGHLKGAAIDVLFDGSNLHEIPGERIESRNTHGTGCILASAIATRLAAGDRVIDATIVAKRFVTRAIRSWLTLGSGTGPANPHP